tara:strand:- start:513 stop:638 length:126 start_codon:yes stop_codon:yes gene_type:complete
MTILTSVGSIVEKDISLDIASDENLPSSVSNLIRIMANSSI